MTASRNNQRAREFTASRNNLRTGWDRAEPGLSPAVLRSGGFGRLFSRRVTGQVYAQPLIVGRTLIVATEQDWVYGLNAVTGRVKWSDRLGTPWSASTSACTDLTPTVGVTSTPVYDPRTRAVYLVAEVVSRSTAQAGFLLFGIKARTGQIRERVPIGGSPFNDAGLSFDAFDQWQRTGLLLLGGRVYAGFGSHCDDKPFTGFVAGVNVATRAVRLWTDETGLSDDEGGIWQSGGGLMSDGPGRIFFTSGNGVSPAPGKGSAPPAPAGRVGGTPGRAARRAAGRPGLLQPAERPGPRCLGRRPWIRRSGGAAVRHQGLPAAAGAGRQGRPGVPAQPGSPRRPDAGPGRRRRLPEQGRPVRAASGDIRRCSAASHR